MKTRFANPSPAEIRALLARVKTVLGDKVNEVRISSRLTTRA